MAEPHQIYLSRVAAREWVWRGHPPHRPGHVTATSSSQGVRCVAVCGTRSYECMRTVDCVKSAPQSSTMLPMSTARTHAGHRLPPQMPWTPLVPHFGRPRGARTMARCHRPNPGPVKPQQPPGARRSSYTPCNQQTARPPSHTPSPHPGTRRSSCARARHTPRPATDAEALFQAHPRPTRHAVSARIQHSLAEEAQTH